MSTVFLGACHLKPFLCSSPGNQSTGSVRVTAKTLINGSSFILLSSFVLDKDVFIYCRRCCFFQSAGRFRPSFKGNSERFYSACVQRTNGLFFIRGVRDMDKKCSYLLSSLPFTSNSFHQSPTWTIFQSSPYFE